MAVAYGVLAVAPPTNTEAAFGDAAIALTGEGSRERLAYFADVQDNSLALSYVIAGLRRVGLASIGLPVATLPSLVGILAQLLALRLLLRRLGSGRQVRWATLAALCNPLVMFLGTRAWPDSLATGLVLLGLAMAVGIRRAETSDTSRIGICLLLLVAACVLKPNLVTIVIAVTVMSFRPPLLLDMIRPRIATGALVCVVVVVGAWSRLVEQPTLIGVGTSDGEASLLRRISDYMRIDLGDMYVTFVRYHAYLALLLAPTALVLRFAVGSPTLRRPTPGSQLLRSQRGRCTGCRHAAGSLASLILGGSSRRTRQRYSRLSGSLLA